MAVAAPARRTAPAPAPSRTTPPRRKAAPARRAPARAPRRVGGQLIPLAGRTAVAVGHLPDSGLVVRMTRGRAWIVVLGVLLAGIVALNVLTLSFSAAASRIDQQAVVLDKENSRLGVRDARLYGTGAMRNAAGALGLAMPSSDSIHFTDAGSDDVAVAAQRLAAAGG
jgi:hypothetical protein